MSEQQINNFDEFFVHYLNEHRNPTSRWLHFVGTSGWLTSALVSTLTSPIAFPAAMAVTGKLLQGALKEGEAERPNWKRVAAMLALPTLASPIAFPAGIVFAYGCAWVGHFGFEKNKPASWRYPLWSLTSDWKMWAEMLQGRLWSSADPVGELNLRQPEDIPPMDLHQPVITA